MLTNNSNKVTWEICNNPKFHWLVVMDQTYIQKDLFATKSGKIWQILQEVFMRHELKMRCCYGFFSFGGKVVKLALDQKKLQVLKNITFFWRPLKDAENMKDCWKVCTKNIDSYLRKGQVLNPKTATITAPNDEQ